MNRHLTPEQFVDAVEQAPAIPADRQAHLAVCQQCAEQLAEMQSLMADVTIAGDVPEPSPLFWDHLSARVRAAVDAEPAPVAWWRAYWRPMVTAVGALAVIVVAVVLRPTPAAVPAIDSASNTEVVLSDEAEAAFAMIGALAPSVPASDAREAGLEPGRGATDAAFDSLTQAQRRALIKLLKAEMASVASE